MFTYLCFYFQLAFVHVGGMLLTVVSLCLPCMSPWAGQPSICIPSVFHLEVSSFEFGHVLFSSLVCFEFSYVDLFYRLRTLLVEFIFIFFCYLDI